MRKEQLIALVARISAATGIETPIIVGSQSLFGSAEEVPETVRASIECDIYVPPPNNERIKQINRDFGAGSEFAAAARVYADGVGRATVVLPDGWQERLRPLADSAGKVCAYCLEPHDAAVSKLMAGREKDLRFIKEIIERGLINLEELAARLLPMRDSPQKDALLIRVQTLERFLRGATPPLDVRPLVDIGKQLS